MDVLISMNDSISENDVVDIYKANGWSASYKPKELLAALNNSHTLVTARISGKLVGLGNAISDGHLVVYYPHLLVNPNYHRMGIGRKIMEAMQSIYKGFHQQVLIADGEACKFYQALGFVRAGNTEPMWIYSGDEH